MDELPKLSSSYAAAHPACWVNILDGVLLVS